VLGARLVGEAGAGKTRLLDELALRAEAEGIRVIRARPDPYWAELPCYTLRSIIQGLARLGERDLEAGRYERANADARRVSKKSWPEYPGPMTSGRPSNGDTPRRSPAVVHRTVQRPGGFGPCSAGGR